MKEKDFKEFENSIIALYSPEGGKIDFDIVEIKKYCSKYSSTHKLTPSLFVDGDYLSVRRGWKITYQCKCGAIHTINATKFLLKEHLTCVSCANTPERNKKHGLIIREIHSGLRQVQTQRVYQRKEYNFSQETEKFKEEYYNNHLTLNEFNSIKKFIYSVNGIVIYNNSKVIFLEHEPCFNHKKYRTMIQINQEKIPFQNIKIKCSHCGKIFNVTRSLKYRFLNGNFQCKCCYLTNTTFSVKIYKENITYQSNLELFFLNKCEEFGIKVENGHTIMYDFKNKKNKYYIDYYLPEYSIQIELKDNHIWHKNQVQIEKWQCKENAAIKYCNENGMVFKLLFPEDVNEFFKHLERDSLTSNES